MSSAELTKVITVTTPAPVPAPTAIELATSRGNYSDQTLELVERLLILEDIEEKEDAWSDLNRQLAAVITDSHLRLGLATWADATERMTVANTIHDAWVKWRRTVLESILNPTQVQLSPAPLHIDPICPVATAATHPNTECLRSAYADPTWLARSNGKWAVIFRGTLSPTVYDTHEEAMSAAMDAHGMLGNFVCPYICHQYCDYKMRIYEAQEAFADDIRDL